MNDDISFKIEAIKPGGLINAVYTGKLKGDTIELEVRAERNGTKIQGEPSIKAKRLATGTRAGK